MRVSFDLGAGVARLARFSAVTGGAVLLAAALAGPASAQLILGSKHDLSSTGAGPNKFTPSAGNSEICVFCHTPHGSDNTAAVPLWNRTLTAGAYTTYNTLGTSSLVGGVVKVGAVSIACLSCHDGATAMNVMINTPGSGTTGTWAGTWAGSATVAGAMTNLTTDLTNDHPVGIQYAGGPTAAPPAAGTDYTNALFRNKDFKTAKSAALNGSTVWWVDATADGLRGKTDMQLYTRNPTTDLGNGTDGTNVLADFGVAAVQNIDQPFVECASCHDPHAGGTGAMFLRISNANSAVCLACHVK